MHSSLKSLALSACLLILATGYCLADMNVVRVYHTLTLLADGRTLAVGGTTGEADAPAGALASAEIYDPTTGVWTYTGSLHQARYNATATLLLNGKVLVVGGVSAFDTSGNANNLTTAEIYDPATGQWTVTGKLHTGRSNAAVNRLPSGKVLVSGGTDVATAEVYNPANGTWTLTGPMVTPRHDHSSVLLANGTVLAVGGVGILTPQDQSQEITPILTQCEVYNPQTNKWTATGSLTTARAGFSATVLANGQVLAAGGYAPFPQPTLRSAELYNPQTGQWTATGGLTQARSNHTATLLPNGKVSVVGGGAGTGTTEVYDPTAGTWSTSPESAAIDGLSNQAAALLPSADVLTSGGLINQSPWITNSVVLTSPTASFASTASMGTGRTGASVTLLPNGLVLVAGGDPGGDPVKTTELYNPATGTWAAGPDMNFVRSGHTATLLANGNVLVAGGFIGGETDTLTAEIYDPVANTWTPTASLHHARDSAQANLLVDGKVLISGGIVSPGNLLASAEIYDPATGTFTDTGSMHDGRVNFASTMLQDGTVLVSGGAGNGSILSSAEIYDPETGTWQQVAGGIGEARESATSTLLPNGDVLLIGGEVQGGTSGDVRLFNPAPGQRTFTPTASLTSPEYASTAILLPSGRVLMLGGTAYGGGPTDNSAYIYDPASGQWSDPISKPSNRIYTSATLLPNGKVLLIDGTNCDLFDPGIDPLPAAQPLVNALAGNVISAGKALVLSGTNFTGISEASSGETNSSASNVPVVRLESLGNEEQITLEMDPAHPFSATSWTGLPLTNFPIGPALLTVTVNGAPSTAQVVVFNDTRKTQTITFNPPATGTATQSIILTATATSRLPVTFSVVSGPATVSGRILTFTGTGTVVVAADQAGNAVFTDAPEVQKSITVGKKAQAIRAFARIPTKVFNQTFTVATPMATSGLPVTLSVLSGPATVSGNSVHVNGTGTVVLAADQTGNDDYSAAAEVTTSFAVVKSAQTITPFPVIPTQTITNGTVAFTPPTSSSGLPVTIAVLSGPATIVNQPGGQSTVTFTGVGKVVLTATQTGDADYNAAKTIATVFYVTLAKQVITIQPIATQLANSGPITINATSNASQPLTYKISGPATLSGNVITLTGKPGIVRIGVTALANADYATATATTAFVVKNP